MPALPKESQPAALSVQSGPKRRFHWAAWVAVGLLAATVVYSNLQDEIVSRFFKDPANSSGVFYRWEVQKGFPVKAWQKWEEGWFLETSGGRKNNTPTAAGVEIAWFGLITNVIFLGVTAVFTLLFTDAMIRHVPKVWASLRAPRTPPPADESRDGEPADPAWDEAKNR